MISCLDFDGTSRGNMLDEGVTHFTDPRRIRYYGCVFLP